MRAGPASVLSQSIAACEAETIYYLGSHAPGPPAPPHELQLPSGVVSKLGMANRQASGVSAAELDAMARAVGGRAGRALCATLYVTPQGGVVVVNCDHPCKDITKYREDAQPAEYIYFLGV
jgi:hypothetical protein